MPSWLAMPGPTWPVSPSMACLPHRIRSQGSSRRMACDRVYAVAQVSPPANSGAERSTARSQPIASASRSSFSAAGGPMDSTVTVPPCASRRRSASSMAYMSNGFTMDAASERRSVFVTGSKRTWVVSGTDLTHTTQCKGGCSFRGGLGAGASVPASIPPGRRPANLRRPSAVGRRQDRAGRRRSPGAGTGDAAGMPQRRGR